MEQIEKNKQVIVQTQFAQIVSEDEPLKLECDRSLAPITVAYETLGTLNEKADNAILICHALSGDAHVAGRNKPEDTKPGWWDIMVGPGKGIDTNKYFVICSNFLGGCSGTTGPSSINPETAKPYGLDFPIITIGDMVKVQKKLIDKLGIEHLLCVIGGSMGAMQALQWTIDYPDMVRSAVIAASTTRLNAQSVAFDAVGRNAILADPNFADGQYHGSANPDKGLAIARMIGHITYLSEESMRKKFGRQLQKDDNYNYDFNSEFSVETYLDHQGKKFVERFDANSYLYITKAMDYFDLVRRHGSLTKAFKNTKSRFLVISFSSDWLFTAAQSEEMAYALAADSKDVSYCSVSSPYGHDAFLLEPESFGALISGFLDSTARKLRNPDNALLMEQPKPARQTLSIPGKRIRVDYELIESLIKPNSKVLDVGSGNGELLARLTADKNIIGRGIEIEQKLVTESIARGLTVTQRDIERELGYYENNTFDYALLSQTVQTIANPEKVFRELLRVAKKVIVSFPNFGHYLCRFQMMIKGRAPTTPQLPFKWHNSPNIHFLTIKDFDLFCKEVGAKIEKKIPLTKSKITPVKIFPNLFAEQAVYLTSKKITSS